MNALIWTPIARGLINLLQLLRRQAKLPHAAIGSVHRDDVCLSDQHREDLAALDGPQVRKDTLLALVSFCTHTTVTSG